MAWRLATHCHHHPLSVRRHRVTNSRRKMQVIHQAVLASGDPPLLYDKLVISNICYHAKNRKDPSPITCSKLALPEVFPPSPSWVFRRRHPMAHRASVIMILYKQVIVNACTPSASGNCRKLHLIVNTPASKLKWNLEQFSHKKMDLKCQLWPFLDLNVLKYSPTASRHCLAYPRWIVSFIPPYLMIWQINCWMGDAS